MARFRGTLQGQRGQASRLGGTKSGLSAQINGWNTGISVWAHEGPNGEDAFQVVLTTGSNGHGQGKIIGTFTKKDLEQS